MFKKSTIILLIGLVSISCFMTVDAGARDHRQIEYKKSFKLLPKAHRQLTHNGKAYFFVNGRYYHRKGGLYVSIKPPIGLVVTTLPLGFISIEIGSNRYYSYDDVYYLRSKGGYVVTNKPAQAASTSTTLAAQKLIIYPANNQSKEQKSRDKYECHGWAVSESSFDPTDQYSNTALQHDYDRAITACLEARQYVVK